MTNEERCIISAYTGFLMTDEDSVHEYIEKKLGRQIEWGGGGIEPSAPIQSLRKEIIEKTQDDFDSLCNYDRFRIIIAEEPREFTVQVKWPEEEGPKPSAVELLARANGVMEVA